MSLLSWLLPRKKPLLSLEQQQRLLQLPSATALSNVPLRSQRWVVVDLETSGLTSQPRSSVVDWRSSD